MRMLRVAMIAGLLPGFACAQMDHASGGMAGMKHEAGVPSTTISLTGLNGESRTVTVQELKAMPHQSVTVLNGHSHTRETYSGVAVKDLLALVATKAAETGTKPPSRFLTVIVAGGTDHYRIAIALCDTDPGCRNGQAVVADAMDGQPLAAEGAFKLILTEDKMPARWVRNLDSLVEKSLVGM